LELGGHPPRSISILGEGPPPKLKKTPPKKGRFGRALNILGFKPRFYCQEIFESPSFFLGGFSPGRKLKIFKKGAPNFFRKKRKAKPCVVSEGGSLGLELFLKKEGGQKRVH
jgi:hypothetical protein